MIYRNTRTTVRFTKNEYKYLCEQARKDPDMHYKNGELNLSGYIRKCVLQEVEYNKDKVQNDIKNLTYQFRKIGVNVNQAAKKINSGYGTGKASMDLEDELRKLNELFGEFLQMMEAQEGDHGGYKAT